MTSNSTIECSQIYPTLSVSDIHATIEFYTKKLGFKLQFIWGDPTVYAGLNFDRVTIHIAASANQPVNKSAINFLVSDANVLHQMHQQNGVNIVVPIDDRDYGIRDYQIADPDGNLLSFGHNIFNQGPAIKIERVEVPVRLEKRLAALLQDLAKHKNMTVSSCLEETLLHSFERIGDNVASPHVSSTFPYIDELKKKHGIDYDSHGSYRFVESDE